MDLFVLVLVAAILVEFVIQTLKEIVNAGKVNWYMLGAAALGIIVCEFGAIDIFKMAGINFMFPYLGEALTGIAIGRGSNLVHDLISNLQNAFSNK